MADEPMGLGPRLIKAREARGWSQRELAHRTGIAVPVLNRLETGERTNPGIRMIKLLARALGVSTDYLCEMDRDGEEDAEGQERDTLIAIPYV